MKKLVISCLVVLTVFQIASAQDKSDIKAEMTILAYDSAQIRSAQTRLSYSCFCGYGKYFVS